MNSVEKENISVAVYSDYFPLSRMQQQQPTVYSFLIGATS